MESDTRTPFAIVEKTDSEIVALKLLSPVNYLLDVFSVLLFKPKSLCL